MTKTMEACIEVDPFVEFPKMARLARESWISEKLDGTNGQIFIDDYGVMKIGSRTRWILPKEDNFGFAKWCHENRDELLKLGPGRHFGEWWGSGIQRGYGLPKGERRFSLFNVARWHLRGEEARRIALPNPTVEKFTEELPSCVGLVPVLYHGEFSTAQADLALGTLVVGGSRAVPGFMNPEGIVIWHSVANVGFKKTIEKDQQSKSMSKTV